MEIRVFGIHFASLRGMVREIAFAINPSRETITDCNGVVFKANRMPRSIFDNDVALRHTESGLPYSVLWDHKAKEPYVIPRICDCIYYRLGKEVKRESKILGERVRPMTLSEEIAFNEDRLYAYVDHWNNVSVDEPFDFEWFEQNCL